MEESGTSDCKRRRITDIVQVVLRFFKRRRTSDTITQPITSIIQLPHDYLSAIADYLPQTSRGLLAVALSAPSASFHTSTGWNCERELSDAGKAIITIKTPLPYQIISLDRSSEEGKKRMGKYKRHDGRYLILVTSMIWLVNYQMMILVHY